MDEIRKKEKIKACIAIGIIILAILITGIITLKYYVEGEKNIPYKLSKITIVSTAEGVENKGTEEKWNLSVYQNNDVYFSIEKNRENEENDELIESISIENIEITKAPNIGKIKIYMPNSLEGRTFSYEEDYIIEQKTLKYKGAAKTNVKNLEIGNQGGTAIIRFSNNGIANYISNEDIEVKHDGSLLEKVGVDANNLKFEVNFDFIIKLKNKSYVSNITLELPCGTNLIEEGTSSQEITEGFIFIRENK